MRIAQKLRLFARHHFTDHPHDGPVRDTLINEVEPLGFSLKSHYQFLSKIDKKLTATVLNITEYQGEKYPIYAVDFQPDSKGQRLFILAGSHGNEEAGLLAIEKYIKFLESENQSDIAVRIVTPHNPIGSAVLSRYNGQGYDMNRDFIKQHTEETRAVVESFQQFKPTVAISLHEGPQEKGAFFFTNKHVDDELIAYVLAELADKGVRLADKSYFGNKLARPGQFPAKGPFLVLIKLWKLIFKLQDFAEYSADQNVPAVVMETSWTTTEKRQRIDAQLIALKKLTSYLS